jgi:hypothetical protein
VKKLFDVQLLDSAKYRAVCFSFDATRPEDYYARLEMQLAKLQVSGEVLLDLLACNGATKRRFIALSFDGQRLRLDTMRIESQEDLGTDVQWFCRSFYARRADKLTKSVLSPVARLTLAQAF